MSGMSGFRAGLGVMVIAGLVGAAPASATPRFASPSGGAADPCTASVPCSIETAINNAVSGDDVTVLAGSYTTATQLSISAGVTVHGTPGAPPTVNTTAQIGIDLTGSGAVLRDLIVEHNQINGTAVVADAPSTIERIRAHAVQNYAACAVGPGTLIRDSVCWYTGLAGADNAALKTYGDVTGTSTVTVRNVTAVASNAPGLWAASLSSSGSLIVNATNVIARSGSGADVHTFRFPGGTGTQSVVLDHSNYGSESEFASGDITDPGSGTNQTAAPVFVNAGAGDFHQTASSAGTVDVGTATGLLAGELDFDGQPRSQGGTPDIGADEFAPPQPPDSDGDGVPDSTDTCPTQPGPVSNNGCPLPPPDTTAPQTSLSKAKISQGKRRAKFTFSSSEPASTFECKLDKKPFKGCTSPKTYKKLKPGKHTFKVIAEDAAGNADPTSAAKKFKIKR